MKALSVAVLTLSAILWIAVASFADSRTLERGSIFFGLPFTVGGEEGNEHAGTERRCLADSVKAGLNVVLIGKSEVCTARTGAEFIYDHAAGGKEFQATRLIATENCSLVAAEEKYPGRFLVAVVGAGSGAVRPILHQNHRSRVPNEIVSRARHVLDHTETFKQFQERRPHDPAISDDAPDVLKAAKGLVLVFKSNPWHDGPIVWIGSNDAFVFEGNCTMRHLLFSVQGRPYLAYIGSYCCDCGEQILFVYDLSDKAPREVYRNGILSD